MHWPADHPVRTDPALAPWRTAASALCSLGRFERVLRHLDGRRVASRVATPEGPAVLKVFASPRGRGNDRRLRLLAGCKIAPLVPRPLGCDATGHVSLVSWSPGVVYDDAPDEDFVAGARSIGGALHALHGSGARFDRSWSWEDEAAQLRGRTPAGLGATVERVVAETKPSSEEPLVSAHRDCHPRQVVCDGGRIAWIDLDDAALAPAALDVGNFVAHLHRDSCLGRRDPAVAREAAAAFLAGYGPVPGDLTGWYNLAVVRLAGLAETRHGRPDQVRTILGLLDRPPA